jgi:hypothetical protein
MSLKVVALGPDFEQEGTEETELEVGAMRPAKGLAPGKAESRK